jgi:hypothetical protein
MPLKVSVGLSQKIGLPDYGSLGASCHVEYEADSTLLSTDLEAFQRQVKHAFVACKQAVQDELHRHQSGPPAANGNGQPVRSVVAHDNGHERKYNGSRGGRKATHSQVRALEAIGHRLQLDLNQWLHQKYGLSVPAELSIKEASRAIDELNGASSSDAHGAAS